MILASVHELGRARLQALGTPSSRAEDWRYVGLRGFEDFQAQAPSSLDSARQAAREALGPLAEQAVLLHDGRLVDGLKQLPGNTEIRTEPDEARLSEWQDRIGRADLAEAHSFAHLAGVVDLRLRCAAEAPVVLVNLVTGGEHGWRLIIDAHPGAIASVLLIHLHLAPARSSCGIEVVGGAGSKVQVDEVQIGAGADASRIGQAFVGREMHLDRDADLSWSTVSSGGALARHLSWAHLNGSGAAVRLSGISVVGGSRQAHHLVRVMHHVGDSVSRQEFKAIVDDEAAASFDGVIHVDIGADGSDAGQNSNNMQLSPRARLATRPQLDIYADDVTAAHGATVGQPDRDEILYLTSRGIDPRLARGLIIEGFIRAGFEHLHLPQSRVLAARHLIAPLLDPV